MGSVTCSMIEGSSKSSTLPWKEMFRSASFRMPRSDPFSETQTDDSPKVSPTQELHMIELLADQSTSYATPEIRAGLRSLSLDHDPHFSLNLDQNSPSVPWQTMIRTSSFRRPDISPQDQNLMMEDQALLEEKDVGCVDNSAYNSAESDTTSIRESSEPEMLESEQRAVPKDTTWMWLAVYVTLAQAALAVLMLLIYGCWRLLDEYLRPIIWAALFSIPLRGIQDTLVEFWSEPLRAGLTDTVLAVPVAILRALADTVIDARDVCSWTFYGEKLQEARPEKNGFLRLVRRLVSFSLFVFSYEQIGKFGAVTLLGLGFIFSSNLSPSTISAVSTLRSDSFRLRNNSTCTPERKHTVNLSKVSRVVRKCILGRLKTILAVALIVGVITGSLAGLIFFSYHIGAEGKDAVISIKSHMQERNYGEKIGIKKWINENDAMELMDWYTNECYGTLLQQIDDFAYKYNISELIGVIKQFVITPHNDLPQNLSDSLNSPQETTKYTVRLRNLMEKPVLDKAKCFATQGMDLSFRILASSKFILDGSAHFLLYIGHMVVSGAAGLVQFLLQSTVFFWVLYYLLISESGGVTEQVMKVLPVQKSVKDRCVNALNNAISGVLLATAEIAFFQGCFTWLLCRLFSIHFVYMSTMLSFISPFLPIFPAWLPALPGAVELMLDGKYILAIGFSMTHLLVMDYGASEIADYVPGYSTYLTGVSIIGGMTLFPSALETTEPLEVHVSHALIEILASICKKTRPKHPIGCPKCGRSNFLL